MKEVAISIHAIENFSINILEGLENYDYIHVDVLDGKFVDNKQDNLKSFELLKNYTNIPIIAHLMVLNPFEYIEKIIKNIDIFEFHYEAEGDKTIIISEVKKYNKKVGVVINPDTPIAKVKPYLKNIDLVLVMSVIPGWSGQKFIPEIVDKVNELAECKKKFGFKIEVDGGINLEYGKKLVGADILCSSSYIFKSSNPNKAIKQLKESDIIN